jgi:hypothetical protein
MRSHIKRMASRLLSRLLRWLEIAGTALVGTLLAVGGLGMLTIAPLRMAQDVHHLFGLGVAVVIIGGVLWGLHWLKSRPVTSREFGIHPKLGLAMNLLAMVLIAIYAFGAVSFSFVKLGWAHYEPALALENGDLSDALLDLYGWHFVDAIPGLDLWDLYPNTRPQLGPSNFLARSMLLLFRIVLLAEAVRLITQKKVAIREQLRFAAERLAQGRLRDAERAIEQALSTARRGESSLDELDAWIALARLRNQQRAPDEAGQALDKAARLLQEELETRELEARRRQIEELRIAIANR